MDFRQTRVEYLIPTVIENTLWIAKWIKSYGSSHGLQCNNLEGIFMLDHRDRKLQSC